LSLVKKALWPSVLAAILMVSLTVVGRGVTPALAYPGEICSLSIRGPLDSSGTILAGANSTILQTNVNYLVIVHVDNLDPGANNWWATLDGAGASAPATTLQGTLGISLDADIGNVDIVSMVTNGATGTAANPSGSTGPGLIGVGPAVDTVHVPTNQVQGVPIFSATNTGLAAILAAYGWTGSTPLSATIGSDCGLATAPNATPPVLADGLAMVNIRCRTGGSSFQITAWASLNAANSRVSPATRTYTCGGGSSTGTIKAYPTKIEIVPALGSVDCALIVVTLKDSSGADSFPGEDVSWSTDNGTIQGLSPLDPDSDFRTYDFFNQDAVGDIFQDYVDNPIPANAADVEDICANLGDVDDFTQAANTVHSFTARVSETSSTTTDTISAAILRCAQGTGCVPGVANILAVVDTESGDVQTILLKTAITVVGPPAAPIVVAADATSVTCGDRVTITVTVKDSKGQNVSDHTLVEAVSTLGSVLGGTGAVAGPLGFVVPISSTLTETFNGVATFFLLTSQTQVGIYDVTISTGGGGAVSGGALGGLFSTPVVTGHVQVSCTLPVVAAQTGPAPTAVVTAPRTGTGGVTPPNTGDAGLATTSGSSWAFYVIAGAVAFALAGVATYKFARR